ncbi:peptidoglycan DD-metalloendopeptidase family protein [Nitratiruptor sp. SB155-2]|uniref:peptidoglycan DD-metalloendopeptidase family protein n=1 Tax=Nitratiruptor sp. (strain SB155-2) TaxID=387092 RepID=UPI0001586E43|nr:peptidoglycan DD-metalloendopeptidase family protein [Nitratiruptor sp. SB155-2]BAF69457.1 peptidase, M23/M37 family [Nitratiruptor sp. SB155-2]
MRYFILILFFLGITFGAVVEKKVWESGDTLLGYLIKHNIPTKLYYDLDDEEKELTGEIRAGVTYYRVMDYGDRKTDATAQNGQILHLLIPVNEELQIHVFKDGDKYRFELIPIHYQKVEEGFSLKLDCSPYLAIKKVTGGNGRLAGEFVRAFRNAPIDFCRNIHSGDRLAILYEQKFRLGDFFGMPRIKAGVVEALGKKYYVFNYQERYYDEKGRELETFFLIRPVRHARITSRFTRKRWHPILHKYRAHLGVDFGAPRGTHVYAAGNGRVIFSGRKGGYGNVIIIAHADGYRTLYAHLQKRLVRRGRRVKQGSLIGLVGNTGLSTGPHLHFGLYKNGRAINPLRVVKITKSKLKGKRLKMFKTMTKRYKEELEKLIQSQKQPRTIRVTHEMIEYFKGGEDGKGGIDQNRSNTPNGA